MDDVLLARMLLTGDLDAVHGIYERYSRELFDYCLTLVDDEDRAADALHDTMLVAVGWAPFLPRPERLRSWLYALARNECLRVDADQSPHRNGGAGAHRQTTGQRPRRVTAAPVDALREVFDLAHRHLMDDREIAVVIGVSPRSASAMRARSEVAFAGLGAAFVPYRVSLRADPPPSLNRRVLESVAAPGRVAYRADAAGPRKRNGFPVPVDHPGPLHRLRSVRVAALVGAPALVLAAVMVLPSAAPRFGVVELAAPIAGTPPASGADRPERGSVAPGTSPTPSPSPSSAFVGPALPRTGGAQAARPSAPRTPAGMPSFSRPSTPRSGAAGQADPKPALPKPSLPKPSLPKPGIPKPSLPKPSLPKPGIPKPSVPKPRVPKPPVPAPPAPPAPRPPLPSGVALVGVGGKCLDVLSAGTASGTPVILFTCNGGRGQRWTLAADATIRALGNCLDLEVDRVVAGTRVAMRRCDGTLSQRWVRSGGLLLNHGARMCLDVSGRHAVDFARPIVWGCHGESNQRWTVRG